MNLYVGITDGDWFSTLSELQPDEVNFWKPGGQGTFGTLRPGELFLFKLHSPRDFIVGGALFVRFSKLPVSLAWLAFGEKNGIRNLAEFHARIRKYRGGHEETDPQIGCIVLTQPFFFERDQWIPAPSDWPRSTVQGKTYDAEESRGYELWSQVQERLSARVASFPLVVEEERARYGAEVMTQMRLGQGGFRVVVTEAYNRSCAITGEKTLPVLEAAHIKPYANAGPHTVSNGLLLRADMHILFDAGLLSVTQDHRIEVSPRIEEQYTNGKLYYSYHGQELHSLPTALEERPSAEFLEWHNESVFVR